MAGWSLASAPDERRSALAQKIKPIRNGPFGKAPTNLWGVRLGTSADAQALAEEATKRDLLIGNLDLREAQISPEDLVLVCRAVDTVARRCGPTHRGGLVHRPPPCWIELGGDASLVAAEALHALHRAGLRCCIPLRCSRQRCIVGATFHFSSQIHTAPVADATEAPFAQGAPYGTGVPLLPLSDAPLLAPRQHRDLLNCRRVFAVCARGAPWALTVEPFEELEVVLASSLGILGTGAVQVRQLRPPHSAGFVDAWNLVREICSEQTFDLLASHEDGDGMGRLIYGVVDRLGGEVLQGDLCQAFARKVCGEGHSFQTLLGMLHDRPTRNQSGIRFPGDDYGVSTPYVVAT